MYTIHVQTKVHMLMYMYIHLIDDFSLVVLEAEKDKEGSDYINASYIDVRLTNLEAFI